MPPISIGPANPVTRVQSAIRNTGTSVALQRAAEQGFSQTANALEALDPGPEPVDTERVAQIRKAIASGTYPLIPTMVADAIIAAGYLLGAPE
jgi:negative regulator of flagellin synthesis FlgM